MYAVFCLCYRKWSRDIDTRIQLFDTEDDAALWCVRKLVEAGELQPYEVHGNLIDILELWQGDLGGLEFFHIYPVIDQRQEAV